MSPALVTMRHGRHFGPTTFDDSDSFPLRYRLSTRFICDILDRRHQPSSSRLKLFIEPSTFQRERLQHPYTTFVHPRGTNRVMEPPIRIRPLSSSRSGPHISGPHPPRRADNSTVLHTDRPVTIRHLPTESVFLEPSLPNTSRTSRTR